MLFSVEDSHVVLGRGFLCCSRHRTRVLVMTEVETIAALVLISPDDKFSGFEVETIAQLRFCFSRHTTSLLKFVCLPFLCCSILAHRKQRAHKKKSKGEKEGWGQMRNKGSLHEAWVGTGEE